MLVSRGRCPPCAGASVEGAPVRRVSVSYRTIVADPPWRVRDFSPGGGGGRGNGWRGGQSRPMPYPTLTLDELLALDVPAADDAHLYLWTINVTLEAASPARLDGCT